MKNLLKITLITAAMVVASVSQATTVRGNAACWGDNKRQDISCQALTDEFLLSLRDATKTEVVKAMGVEGRALKPDSLCRGVTCSDELHFISNYSKGTHWGAGDINFLFDQDGRVSLIFGSIDPPNGEGRAASFIWNADLLPAGCSDLPHSLLKSCDKI
jgi:hypothetical protein